MAKMPGERRKVPLTINRKVSGGGGERVHFEFKKGRKPEKKEKTPRKGKKETDHKKRDLRKKGLSLQQKET